VGCKERSAHTELEYGVHGLVSSRVRTKKAVMVQIAGTWPDLIALGHLSYCLRCPRSISQPLRTTKRWSEKTLGTGRAPPDKTMKGMFQCM
jgi:hypothetical protein